jgi:hypothetical protein
MKLFFIIAEEFNNKENSPSLKNPEFIGILKWHKWKQKSHTDYFSGRNEISFIPIRMICFPLQPQNLSSKKVTYNNLT